MNIVIVGGGLIGLTSAWSLAREGHEIIVIDRGEGPGLETSFANGSLLTPSMSDPWNAPGSWKVLLRSIGQTDAALQLRLQALPSLSTWGLRFLWNSRRSVFARNTRANLTLALHSLAAMENVRAATGVDYGRRTGGSLRIFRDQQALDHAAEAARLLEPQGVGHHILSREQAVALEQGLAPIGDALAGGIHYPVDETGDAYLFCVGIAEAATALGVTFRFGVQARRLEMENGRIAAVATDRERIRADAVLIAAGSFSPGLARTAGLTLPVRPAKGYSVTVDQDKPPLSLPVIDDALHAAVVPLEGRIRAAGTAEFAGYDRRLDPMRVGNLIGLLHAVLPQMEFDEDKAQAWCGLRAMSADGVPIIGRSRIENLWISTGHGHLGWTMAAGSAQLLADLVSGRKAAIDPAPYAPARFGR